VTELNAICGADNVFTDEVCVIIIEHQAAAAVSKSNKTDSNSKANRTLSRRRGVIREASKQTNKQTNKGELP
jgi:choline kinase